SRCLLCVRLLAKNFGVASLRLIRRFVLLAAPQHCDSASLRLCVKMGATSTPRRKAAKARRQDLIAVDGNPRQVQGELKREGAQPVRGKGRAHPQPNNERTNILSA